ncbi:hypothetical protein [Vibrio aestuarianus]|uniref:hypothetical protein n=1 Tax=Vibrio aestuarianus TaxID=28171 RepID=UPI00237D2670|nr:hypothetical protein [Vibrio aestuarianus]MDE1211965.1 hypothetical protein [Vibrio aestuarianus]MDE1251268.1 hypothetical protein [Vibrio aestuarianus]MDE1312652.1 hypothetical protein [Vibrio aestuarianus]MDE1319890.1 hypothetical protein [Vibrio aestuarianus]
MKKVLVVLFILLPFSLQAEGRNASLYLMSTPASLMDIGILKTNLYLEDYPCPINEQAYGVKYCSVSYDYGEDKIFIDFSFDIRADKEAVLESIIIFKRRLSIDPKLGKFTGNTKNSSISYNFTYEGYQSKNQPADILDSIDKMIVIRSINAKVNCETKMLSNKVICDG